MAAKADASGRTELARPSGVVGIVNWVERACAVAAERRALRGADESALKDIGLSRADVEVEARRPFWDLPAARPSGRAR